MIRFAPAAAAAVLLLGLGAPPALARGGAPSVPQGLSIDGIIAGQPLPGDPVDEPPGTPGLREATRPATAR